MKTLSVLATFVALAGACSVKLDEPAGYAQVDGAIDGRATDAESIDAEGELDAPMVTIDAPRCSARQVVLVFDGITLTNGPANALARTAPWVGEATGQGTATIPAYRANDPNRAAVIQTVLTEVQARLAQFPIIVTQATEATVPTTGEVILIALGGNQSQSGSAYQIARNVLDCGDAAPNDVAWIADATPIAKVDDYIVGAIAYGLGLGGTLDPGNCMCSWRTDCNQNSGDCTLSTAAQAANDVCGQTPNPQNQVAAFETAFCQ